MRLINVFTFALEEFIGEPSDHGFPRYAILSHTWGLGEVTFQDMNDIERARRKPGFRKIEQCCLVARADGLQWAWVDTCCIDKKSSAELSEAINAMFKWYQASAVCYAFLGDIESEETLRTQLSLSSDDKAKLPLWFRRGWTLQELIAPLKVVFYSCCPEPTQLDVTTSPQSGNTSLWLQLGDKSGLREEISTATGIPIGILCHTTPISEIPVGSRMVWASYRLTTRREDLAYSLLGIFDINMPLLYGEGDKAFMRLQAEILRTTGDHTIFLGNLHLTRPPWYDTRDSTWKDLAHILDSPSRGLFAPSPHYYTANVQGYPADNTEQWEQPIIMRMGINMTIPLKLWSSRDLRSNSTPDEAAVFKATMKNKSDKRLYIGALQCFDATKQRQLVRFFLPGPSTKRNSAVRNTQTPRVALVATDYFYWADLNEAWSWDFTPCTIITSNRSYTTVELSPPAAKTILYTDNDSTTLKDSDWKVHSRRVVIAHSEPVNFYLIVNASAGLLIMFACSIWPRGLFSVIRGAQRATEPFEAEFASFREYTFLEYYDSKSVHRIYPEEARGPVAEFIEPTLVMGCSAELVITIFCGINHPTKTYRPEFRFRNCVLGRGGETG